MPAALITPMKEVGNALVKVHSPYLRIIPVVIHESLKSHLKFVPYPPLNTTTTQVPSNQSGPVPIDAIAKMFCGNVPRSFSLDLFIPWLVSRFAGRDLLRVEPIVRQSVRKGTDGAIGCAHIYCHRDVCESIAEALNGKILCDQEGLWVASTESEKELLHMYCQDMFLRGIKFCNLPRGTVNIEVATSTLLPPQHMVTSS